MLSEGQRGAGSGHIPLSVPHLDGNEWTYLKECLDGNWVSSAGRFVGLFEEMVREYTGAGGAVATASGTAALHLALRLAGVRPGDEVLVPALTFVAPVNAVTYCGAEPVFLDVDRTWQLDPERLERFLDEHAEPGEGGAVNRRSGKRIRAVLPVHVMGLAADVDRIRRAADRFGMVVVEDAAEALGVRRNGRHAGTGGPLGCLSFNGNKIVTSGGGGMLLTLDEETAEHGRYLSTQAKDDSTECTHGEIGFNYRLTNLEAAVGVAQMERLEHKIARKREIAGRYREELVDLPGVEGMPQIPGVDATYWLYTILVDESEAGVGSRALLRSLAQRGIETRPLWHPVYRLGPYRSCWSDEIEMADELQSRALSLPSSVGLTPADQSRVVDELRSIVLGAARGAR